MPYTPTPSYNYQILILKEYALKLNWFQRWFFPDILSQLALYPDAGDASKAYEIYAIILESKGILNWIGQRCLSGYRSFMQDAFTQMVNNLEELTEESFISCSNQFNNTEMTNESMANYSMPNDSEPQDKSLTNVYSSPPLGNPDGAATRTPPLLPKAARSAVYSSPLGLRAGTRKPPDLSTPDLKAPHKGTPSPKSAKETDRKTFSKRCCC